MPELWFPGATPVPPTSSQKQGLTMVGSGERFFTWHTYEADPLRLTAYAGARALNAAGTTPTFCFNPISGDLMQMLPATKGCYTLRNLAGGVDTNFRGTIHMQMEVIAYAAQPFTSYMSAAGWKKISALMDWLESWGIPRVFPAGQPLGSYGARHNRIAPAGSGHYGHSQWKEQDHWDPGYIDYRRILQATEYVAMDPVVKNLQEMLAAEGLLKPSDVDGVYGPITAAAEKEYKMLSEQINAINKKLDTILESLVVPTTSDEAKRVFGTKASSLPLGKAIGGAGMAARRSEIILNVQFPEATELVRSWTRGETATKPGSTFTNPAAEK